MEKETISNMKPPSSPSGIICTHCGKHMSLSESPTAVKAVQEAMSPEEVMMKGMLQKQKDSMQWQFEPHPPFVTSHAFQHDSTNDTNQGIDLSLYVDEDPYLEQEREEAMQLRKMSDVERNRCLFDRIVSAGNRPPPRAEPKGDTIYYNEDGEQVAHYSE